MLTLKFNLRHQNITLVNKAEIIASDSKNYLQAHFNLLSDDWNNSITAIFKSDNIGTYTVLLDDDNNCLVPWELLKPNAVIKVSAFCDNLHTAVTASFKVAESGYTEGETPSEPTPTVYEQILKGLDSKQNKLIAGEGIKIEENVISAVDAKSAYEIALEHGFIGSEEDWLKSLKGEQGEKGQNGADGKTPVKGVDYFTAEDKTEFTAGVTESLKPELAKKQDKLTAGSITTDNIASKAVTTEKLAEDVTNQLSKLKDDLAEFYKPVSDLDNRKDVDLFISDSYGNVLATFKDGEFITKEFSTVKSIGNNICDTLEECDLAISDVQGNVVFCIVDGNIITPKYNAKNHYKTFSILGDSYSTFKDYTDPLNNTQWYPPSDSATQGSENDVEDVENTWWHLFANDYKSLLIQNNSYSGSCISYDSYGTGTVDGKNFSFVKRCENLKKAELIIIEGGTNDAWSNVPLGEYKYSNWVESDFETFRPACSYVLDYIKRNNIGAKIIFVLNNGLKSSITESIKNICNYYNVDVLELSNIKKSNNHPNIEGMKQIKEQLINFLTRSDFNG
jgi:hypothetical protein|nr:MAG TPA: GDSL-like Lipase/Acylhydrolase [Caudoviricetes sp.]